MYVQVEVLYNVLYSVGPITLVSTFSNYEDLNPLISVLNLVVWVLATMQGEGHSYAIALRAVRVTKRL